MTFLIFRETINHSKSLKFVSPRYLLRMYKIKRIRKSYLKTLSMNISRLFTTASPIRLSRLEFKTTLRYKVSDAVSYIFNGFLNKASTTTKTTSLPCSTKTSRSKFYLNLIRNKILKMKNSSIPLLLEL